MEDNWELNISYIMSWLTNNYKESVSFSVDKKISHKEWKVIWKILKEYNKNCTIKKEINIISFFLLLLYFIIFYFLHQLQVEKYLFL